MAGTHHLLFIAAAVCIAATAAMAYTPMVMEEFEEDNTQYLWPAAAEGYVDTAGMTGFSQMALSPDTLSIVDEDEEDFDYCRDGYTLVQLPLGPACVANDELESSDRCGSSCSEPSICWRGVCVDAKENLCMRIDDETQDVTFVPCNE